MRKRHGLHLAVLLVAGVGLCGSGLLLGKDGRPSPAEQYESWYAHSFAVVVGIDGYPAGSGWPQLRYAVNDARLMAQVLAEQGFEVLLLVDEAATKTNVLRALQKEFTERMTDRDRFVLYFSGHGQSFVAPATGQALGYLIPFDGKRENGEDDVATYVSMAEIRDVLKDFVPARHKQVFVDACFSGLIATRGILVGSRAEDPVADALSKRGTMVVTAGDVDEPVQDGCFTRLLAEGLRGNADGNGDGYIPVDELAAYLSAEVSKQCDMKQTPFVGSLAGSGQMVFAMHAGAMGSVRDGGGRRVEMKAPAVGASGPRDAEAPEDSGKVAAEPHKEGQDAGSSGGQGTVNVDGAAPSQEAASFVEEWARWQTEGDFAAYSAAYAQDFVGVKRTREGGKTTFNRKQWLEDRAKMFKTDMTVAVREVQVEAGRDEDRVVVSFRQYWRNPKYADQGEKTLELRRSGSGWLIVREEMRTSSPWDGVLP